MKNIKNIRTALGITQTQMAERFQVVQSAIVKWESADGYPPSRLIPQIAKYLGCTIDDLYQENPKEAG